MFKFKGYPFFLFFLLLGMTSYGQQTFRDNFSSVSYSNNNGTNNFSTDWNETNDNNNPGSGRIRITGNELRFEDISVNDERIQRSANINGASIATLSFDWQTSGLDGSGAGSREELSVQISSDGTSFTTIGTFDGSQSGSFSQNILAYASANTTVRFINLSPWTYGDWESGEYVYIDNFLISATLGPSVIVNDVAVNEGDGTAVFTVTHVGTNVGGSFTVNYQTVDGTATGGSDFTAIASGTLTFNGTAGDTEQITVNITDDTLYETTEDFSIQFTGVSNPSVNIADTAIGTINDNEVILNNTPLVLYEEFDGYIGYTSTGNTLRSQPNTGDPCALVSPLSSSNTLTSAVPAGGTIDRAYLYWAHSSATPDSQVTFEGTTVNADLMYTTSLSGGRVFYGGVSDVTSIVTSIPNPNTNVFDFSGLTIDTSSTYCNSATVLGGWSLIVFYTDLNLPASTINLYQGFHGESNSSSTYTLDGFFAIGATGSKTTALSWEGDQTLSNNEGLTVTTGLGTFPLTGDGDNTLLNANPFNSTIYDNTGTPTVNNTAAHGVDLDTYDVSPFIQPGESSVTTNIQSGQDFVILNAVVLKVPSNLITGTVFEDINYGGGLGRNLASASGVPLPGVTVELYDGSGVLRQTSTTGPSGRYVFAGMANGVYSVRVVNSSVRSSRGGGSSCATCLPVQTFRKDYLLSTLTEVTDEVGGANPAGTDPGTGTLTGAQSVASVTILSEGVAGLDFGFNFNTIVNTNEEGQGSLEQFIVNSNELDETGLDIEANGIFDPTAGEDTSIFMIPPTGDALGRTADTNFTSGYFDIFISDGAQLTELTSTNTIIDGRTQTAYSGDTNSGTIGSGGSTVGTSATTLPNYNLPEIQVRGDSKEIFRNDGTLNTIRNLAIFLNDKSAIQINNGSLNILENLIGVNALGVNTGDMEYGVEITDGSVTIARNYLSGSDKAAILIDGGTATFITNNHLTDNGNDACKPSIEIKNGDGIVLQTNLIENSGGYGVDGENISSPINIDQNTITTSGFMGGGCLAAIVLGDDDASVTGNIIHTNAGAGLELLNNSSGNLISQNSFYANGTVSDALGIDLDQDGVTLNDNSDSDNGANGLLNFPVIFESNITGSAIVIEGWARPGAIIEFFLTDINEGNAVLGDNQLGMTTDYGEGQTYIGTAVEGSGADLDSGSSSYTDLDGNTDTTNRFKFSIPLPSGVTKGEYITATATLGNSTSEFSPFSILKVYTVITNRRITYRVNKI